MSPAVPLMSQRQYARERGLSPEAVRKRTVTAGGPIPTHGAAKQIDSDEADRLWMATMHPGGASTSRFQGPPAPETNDATRAAPPPLAATAAHMDGLVTARTAVLLTEAQLKRLRYQDRRAQLLDRQAVLANWLGTVHAMRAAWTA
jgi:hypothetical protein